MFIRARRAIALAGALTRSRPERIPACAKRFRTPADIAYAEGKVFVSGIAAGPSPSNVREIPFPFSEASAGTSVEIYHGAHGRVEDYAAIRTFVPINIDGEASLLAGFTCTPLVKFPINSLKPGEKTRGTTVAELGNRNRPLDMIVYKKEGENFLLMANSARGVMKISVRRRRIGDPARIHHRPGRPPHCKLLDRAARKRRNSRHKPESLRRTRRPTLKWVKFSSVEVSCRRKLREFRLSYCFPLGPNH